MADPLDDLGTDPGAISFMRQADIVEEEAVGPATRSVSLAKVLATIPGSGPVLVKMDLGGWECSVLASQGVFSSGHPLPYLLVAWPGGRPGGVVACTGLEGMVDRLYSYGYTPRCRITVPPSTPYNVRLLDLNGHLDNVKFKIAMVFTC